MHADEVRFLFAYDRWAARPGVLLYLINNTEPTRP
jgi:hypothetical protein